MIRSSNSRVKIEPSNITLQTIRAVAETGVDVSSSAPITNQHGWI